MVENAPRGRVERADGWVRRHPIVLVLLLALFVLGTVTSAVGVVSDAHGWYNDRFRWRDREYDRLAQLRSDITTATFDRLLGAPRLERTEGNWAIYTYSGRGWWVQALERKGTHTVGLFAVTTCSSDFRPTFHVSGIGDVVLNRTRLSAYPQNVEFVRYWIYASQAPSFYVTTPGAHVFNYKSAGWGLNGVCPGAIPKAIWDTDFIRPTGRPNGTTPAKGAPKALLSARANTYVEWGPSEWRWPTAWDVSVGEVEVNLIAGRCVVGCLGNTDTESGN